MTTVENVMVGAFCRYKNPEMARKKAMEVINFVGLATVPIWLPEALP